MKIKRGGWPARHPLWFGAIALLVGIGIGAAGKDSSSGSKSGAAAVTSSTPSVAPTSPAVAPSADGNASREAASIAAHAKAEGAAAQSRAASSSRAAEAAAAQASRSAAAASQAAAAQASRSAAAAAAAAKPKGPTRILEVTGTGEKTTQNITVSANWSVSYAFDCSAFGGTGNFQIYAMGGDFPLILSNQLAAKGQDTSFGHQAGTFYLEVNSECSWSLGVYDTVGA